MSKTKRVLLVEGLLGAALIGLMPGAGAAGDQSTPARPGASPAAGANRYLLLTNGRLIEGRIAHDDMQYTVTTKFGVIPFPRRQVERSFDTVQEAYQYLQARVPEDDPSERLQLARWCLSLRLTTEARTQLQKVLEISPDHGPAKAMMEKLAQSDISRAPAGVDKVDADVRQTSAEEVVGDRPGQLDAAVLRNAERRLGISGLPVIFNLPQAMAVQRAEQFRAVVHPVLQAYCARCHNSEYQGKFQLVPASKPRQRTPDVLRANLDATLGLIDPENPAKSELLSSTLRPHGNNSRRRSIFTGSNDPVYRLLATWVNSLRPSAGAVAAARSDAPESGEMFAADRNRSGTMPLEPAAPGNRMPGPRHLVVDGYPEGYPAERRTSRNPRPQAPDPDAGNQSDDDQFPLPYMLGGVKPKLRQPAGIGDAGQDPAGAVKPDAGRRAPADPAAPMPGAGAAAAAAARKRPVKLDPAILKKLLEKNAYRPTGD